MKTILRKGISAALVVTLALSTFASGVAQALTGTYLSDNSQYYSDYAEAEKRGQTDFDDLTAGEDYIQGEVIICMKPSAVTEGKKNSADSDLDAEYDLADGEIVSDDISVPVSKTQSADGVLYHAYVDEDQDIIELCEELNKESDVYFAQPNMAYQPDYVAETDATELVNSYDYARNQKWWMDNCHVPDAWTYTNGKMGQNVTVSVIDTGCNTAHEELQKTFWQHPSNSNICGYYAYTGAWIYKGDESLCNNAHGTHTTGSVAMAADGWGYLGTACQSKVMVMKANREGTSSESSFYTTEVVKCLEKSVELGADIISLSLGGYNYDQTACLAYEKAAQSAVIVTSAGNDHTDTTENLHFPSAYSCVIGVMATGNSSNKNKLATFSNYDTTGQFYKLASPGTAIYSTSNEDAKGYKSMQGTSMATPIAAGMIATYMSYMKSLGKNWTPAQYQYMIESTVNKAGNTNIVTAYSKSYHPVAYSKDYKFKMLDLLYLCQNGKTLPSATTVSITNSDLMTAITSATGKTSLTNYDVARIATLNTSSLSVAAYKEALDKLPNLEYIDFAGNSKVKADIKSNGLADYASRLSESVCWINLSGCGVTNLTPLASAKCKWVSNLNLSSNSGLTDLSPLREYTAVHVLNIASTGVSDISVVGGMTYLDTLTANSCSVTDASPIKGLAKLKSVNLSSNKITDIDAFKLFKGTTLNISSNYISTTYSPDYESELSTILTNMKNANSNTGTLTYSSQKSVDSAMTVASNITSNSTVNITRANFANKNLKSLANVKVVNSSGSAATIHPYIVWSASTSGYADLNTGNTTHWPQLIKGNVTVTFTAKLSPYSSSTSVSKAITFNITAPEITSATLSSRDCSSGTSFTMTAVTNTSTDRILVTDASTRIAEFVKGASGITTSDSGTTRTWTVTLPRSTIYKYSTMYVFPGDSLGYAVNSPAYSSSTSLVYSSAKTSATLSGLSHTWTTTSSVGATCYTEGSTTQKCSKCNLTNTTTVAKKNHSYGSEVEIPASCDEQGSTAGRICSLCQSKLRGGYATATPGTGHNYVRIYDGSTSSTVYLCKVCGVKYTGTVGTVYAPTYANRSKAGLSAQYVNSSGAFVDYVPMTSTGAIKDGYYLALTNHSTQSATVTKMSSSFLGTRFTLEETSNIVIAPGETRKLKVLSGSAPSNGGMKSGVTITYQLNDFRSASTGELVNLTTYAVGAFYYFADPVEVTTQVLDNPVTGRKVDVNAGLTATAGYLTRTAQTNAADPASFTADYYVDYGTYPTWASAGFKWKFKANYSNQYYFQHEDKYSGTVSIAQGNSSYPVSSLGTVGWTGSTTTTSGSAAKILSANNLGSTSTTTYVAWSGNIPKGSTTATTASYAVISSVKGSSGDGLQIHASQAIANSAYFNFRLNVFSYDKKSIRSTYKTYSETGYLSYYYNSSAMSTWRTALMNNVDKLGNVKVLNKDVQDSTATLTTAKSTFDDTACINACATVTDYNYGSNDRSSTTQRKYTYRYYVASQSAGTYDIPLDAQYLEGTNRNTPQSSVTFSGTGTSYTKSYYYWTINTAPLSIAAASAQALVADDFTVSSWSSVGIETVVDTAMEQMTEDGSDSPANQSVIDNAAKSIDDAIASLVERMTASQVATVTEYIDSLSGASVTDYCDVSGAEDLCATANTYLGNVEDTAKDSAQELIAQLSAFRFTPHTCEQGYIAPSNGKSGYHYFACTNCERTFVAEKVDGEFVRGALANSEKELLDNTVITPAPSFNLAAIFGKVASGEDSIVSPSVYARYLLHGASLRVYPSDISSDVEYQNMRFTTCLEVPVGATVTDYGWLYTQTRFLNGGVEPEDNDQYGVDAFVIGGDNIYQYSVKNKATSGSGYTVHPLTSGNDAYTFNLVIKVNRTNWARHYAARSYITYNYEDEDYTVYDSDYATRSVEYIAQQIVAHPGSEKESVYNHIRDNVLSRVIPVEV